MSDHISSTGITFGVDTCHQKCLGVSKATSYSSITDKIVVVFSGVHYKGRVVRRTSKRDSDDQL